MNTRLLPPRDDILNTRTRIFRPLGDEARLRIFQTIIEEADLLPVNETSDHIQLSPSLVPHHLQCLKDCTLVTVTKAGRNQLYQVARPAAVDMVRLADEGLEHDPESVLGCSLVKQPEAPDD